MITNSTLDQVAKNLETDENYLRIKKLIYCACKHDWQNDQNILERFNLTELIQELCSFNPTVEHLNYTFYQIVNTLSKPREYSLIANLILNEVEKLYVINEELTGIIFNQSQPPTPSNILENFSNYQVKLEYNKFDLRQNIMQYTNPLRAKLVLYFALYNKSHFLEEDWLKLKAEGLDDLLEKLFDSCATITELESKLNHAVISLGNEYEETQAAGAIMQFMQGFYSDISYNKNQYQPVQSYSPPETITIAKTHHDTAPTNIDEDLDYFYDENDQDNTCQLISPPNMNIHKRN